jgi:nitroreductase/dihydropteridine reductase
MNFSDIVLTRYATKAFEAGRTIPEADIRQILDLLRFSPSSVNCQPWHFIVAGTEAGRRRIAQGAQGPFIVNEAKIMAASHVILFCAKTGIDDAYLEHILEVEDAAGRFPDPALKERGRAVRAMYVDLHRYDRKDAQHWMEKQVYLNVGTVLLGAGALGIDAVPLEGIDPKALDAEFGLREQGFTAVVAVALGYRAATDANAALPKARLPMDETFTFLE